MVKARPGWFVAPTVIAVSSQWGRVSSQATAQPSTSAMIPARVDPPTRSSFSPVMVPRYGAIALRAMAGAGRCGSLPQS